ncbi:preprotein translocase subunit SecA [Salsipaludibacter albus]|uniref:preprotein translocase subunit SecA n=1 Tax=Salsipaludibacter albus TaxID=2849650 RepID=UPI001EE4143A|nr:preprotein translocase subunit SecA [Salsipaludibacter albus]MBY5163845.1 preprotein translocase subunit SecA [Salsipaludibacter albus]
MVSLNPLRWGEGRKARKIWNVVDEVNAQSDDAAARSDAELAARTDEFRGRLEAGETLDDLLPEAYATVREAAWRVLKQRPYDVQVFGGIALHRGNIAEMKTGEGKTLTSTMPVYLNALEGWGVHVVTVNEYLAKRDAAWMGRIHEFLGIEVGVVHSNQDKAAKRRAYDADVTYGTTNEFGFDYLRDNMAWDRDSQVQRGHHFALLDEVDSILIDEARTPLIISGQPTQSAQWYQIFAKRVVPNLRIGEDLGEGRTTNDYVVDEAKRTVGVTEEGVAKVEKLLGIDNLYESVNTPLIHHLNNAIKARELYKRDREYIVTDGEVRIVDEQTGRVLEGRRYSEGLHQSIEAKEGVRVKEENQTLATVTLQNYYRQYDKLAGMTGTAKTEEVEFLEIYELGVVEVDTNEPVIRDDKSDQIYKTEQAKFESVVRDIEGRHAKGQPVLVGTTSVEKSERLSTMLTRVGVPHRVLNAKQHAREAHVVAQAGQPGAVTVATNMAGRGTDILLGGNPEELARAASGIPLGGNSVDEAIALVIASSDDEELTAEDLRARYDEALADNLAGTKTDRQKVLEAGGLYVIGTERHDSRRIDNQLRGRSGRQGDPGESRFFLSLEDDLMRLFNASAVDSIMGRLNIPDDVPIEAKMVTRAVGNAQRQVESRNFDIRKNVLKYDDVLNEQRKVVYSSRQDLVEGDDEAVAALADTYLTDVVEDAFDAYAPPGVFPEEWDIESLHQELTEVYEPEVDLYGLDWDTVDRDRLVDELVEDIHGAYETRTDEVGGPEVMRQVERRVILSVVDRKWRQHLYEMDALRDGIGLRAVGQRDPLTEYQREAYASFTHMMSSVKQESSAYFFHLPVQTAQERQEEAAKAEGVADGRAAASITVGGASIGKVEDVDARHDAGDDKDVADATHVVETGPDDEGVADDAEDSPQVVFDEQPDEPGEVTYSAATSGGSADYEVGSADGTSTGRRPAGVGASPNKRDDGTTVRRVATGTTYTTDDDEFADVGRNDPCPCGSGKKFKKCHLK